MSMFAACWLHFFHVCLDDFLLLDCFVDCLLLHALKPFVITFNEAWIVKCKCPIFTRRMDNIFFESLMLCLMSYPFLSLLLAACLAPSFLDHSQIILSNTDEPIPYAFFKFREGKSNSVLFIMYGCSNSFLLRGFHPWSAMACGLTSSCLNALGKTSLSNSMMSSCFITQVLSCTTCPLSDTTNF